MIHCCLEQQEFGGVPEVGAAHVDDWNLKWCGEAVTMRFVATDKARGAGTRHLPNNNLLETQLLPDVEVGVDGSRCGACGAR